MGSNLTEEALQRAARSVTALQAICQSFDNLSGVPFGTSAHTTRSGAADMAKVALTVIDRKLLTVIPGRKHICSSFPDICLDPLWAWNKDDTKKWVEEKQQQFSKYRGAGAVEGNEPDPDASDDED